MENRSHALIAGIFVVVLSICIALVAWWFSGRGEETRDYLLVTRGNVTGLNPQAQVRYRGIRAGKVEDISLDPKDPRNILVLIRIDDDIPMTQGTTARLNSQGVTGLSYVMLEDDGTNPQPLVGQKGQPPRIALRASTMDSLSDAVGRIAKLFDDKTMQDMKRTLGNVADASEGMKELPAIMASVRQVLNEENLRNIRALVSHLEKTAGQAAPLTAQMREVAQSLQQLSKRFDQLGSEANATTLPRINGMLKELEQNSRALNRVLENMEDAPQSVIFGRVPAAPGPGEGGAAK
ncbi:MAG TPA: MlaD family protein [Rhodocyclaceae bacterium]|nr:MlaD family protein [Rhodocyclaceae bacterium]